MTSTSDFLATTAKLACAFGVAAGGLAGCSDDDTPPSNTLPTGMTQQGVSV